MIGRNSIRAEDVTLDVDTGRDFDQLKSIRGQFEHTALRHIKHRLPAMHRVGAGERAMLNFSDKFRHVAVLDHVQAPVLDRDAEAPRRKGANEHHLLGVLTDVDKAAGAREARAEFAHVQIAFAVGLREPKKRRVKAAAIIEVELVGLVDNGLVR